ncbi:hypothetical protein DS2_13824 [Catenovulum agarivorans DS-2]|uniref:Xylose isomerase-like TIM barrel domain-containing protein n=1 Tax=Catenovulum agarivorans DS-2 TaxID=1328313 RepID=W7QB27_9ALTE|nr:sugar phosphate isomerase/epimerase [Catenovulum agarivorans]EWH09156.1 hypothetical protein DS2_13824 [Catenovulum agarivorans DS-2]
MIKLTHKLFSTLILLSLSWISHAQDIQYSQLPISVQLHSVKDDVIADFEGTLRKIADIGFEGVEFAGRYGPYQNDPKGLKQFLNTLGLKVSGAHIGVPQLRGQKGDENLAFLKALGAKLLIIPHDPRIDNPAKIDELMQELTTLSEKVNEMGMHLGYHNHSKEFKTFKNSTYWDYLAQNTPKNFFLQLDIGWANYAGENPHEYIKKYPNRTLTTHIKIRTVKDKALMDKIDRSSAIVIGQDKFNWPALVKTMKDYGGTQWLVVEQEETHVGQTRMQAVEASYHGLKRLLN